MDTIDLSLLQTRVETLIARVEIMGQDVASLRQRMEEISANVQLETERLRTHADAEFKRVLDGQASMTAMLQQLLAPRPEPLT